MKKVELVLLHENPELTALAHYAVGDDCQLLKSMHIPLQKESSDVYILESSMELFRKKTNPENNPKDESETRTVEENRLLNFRPILDTPVHSPPKIVNRKYADYIIDQKVYSDKNFSAIIGNSDVIKKVKRELYFVCEKECKVLLCGESGTGKSMLARILHQISLRKNEKFVSVNVGALPKDLIESSLFGTVKGAFTDAKDKKGLIHLAEHGTIFLDEIGELPLSCQTKLLHTLDDGTFRKVGSEIEEKTDARFIFATNANLKELIKQKLFREDLYWRIAEFVINIPPLRSRGDDIVLISERLLENINEKNRKHYYLTESAIDKIRHHDWPGNIRELKSTINIATIFAQSDGIEGDDISFEN